MTVYSGIGRRTDKGEPGAARAFCGIDYSLLSRCTSRVKSTPLSTAAPTLHPSLLPLLLYYLFHPFPSLPFSYLLTLFLSFSLLLIHSISSFVLLSFQRLFFAIYLISTFLYFLLNSHILSYIIPSLFFSLSLFQYFDLPCFNFLLFDTLPHLRAYRVGKGKICTSTRCFYSIVFALDRFRCVCSYVIADKSHGVCFVPIGFRFIVKTYSESEFANRSLYEFIRLKDKRKNVAQTILRYVC